MPRPKLLQAASGQQRRLGRLPDACVAVAQLAEQMRCEIGQEIKPIGPRQRVDGRLVEEYGEHAQARQIDLHHLVRAAAADGLAADIDHGTAIHLQRACADELHHARDGRLPQVPYL